MIRFVDCTTAYWTHGDRMSGGPFAFIDTVTDRFVAVGGQELFFDREEFEDACRVEAERGLTLGDWTDRMRTLIPDGFSRQD